MIREWYWDKFSVLLEPNLADVKSDVKFFFRLEVTDHFYITLVYRDEILNPRVEGSFVLLCVPLLAIPSDLCMQSRMMANAEN